MTDSPEVGLERDLERLLAEHRSLEILFLSTINAFGGKLVLLDEDIQRAIPEHFKITRFNDAARGRVVFTSTDHTEGGADEPDKNNVS